MEGPTALLTREIFGNVSSASKALFYLLSFISLGIFAWGVYRRVRLWRIGRPLPHRIPWRAALGNLWRFVLMQRRLRGHRGAGFAHRLLFGGFVILTIGTILVAIEHVAAKFAGRSALNPVFHKGLYFAIYEVVLDAAGLALLAGCAFFAWRRWKRPPEVAHDSRDWIVLALLVIVGFTGYPLEGLRIVREQTPTAGLSFVGALFGRLFEAGGMTAQSASAWHIALWWFHAILALTLIALFPFTRLLHAIGGVVRLAAGLERLGTLPLVSMEQFEASGEIGVARFDQFTRRQIVELDACVSCGRCEIACPAFEAGKPLSPRNVVQDLRRELERTRGIATPESPPLAGGVIAHETLWSCTACSACTDVCPLGVRPLDMISDMRRFLVGDGQLRGAPAQALQKMDRSGNPWGMAAQDRMAWAAGLRVPTIQENPTCEVLYWVGCAAAYDRRLQKVARSVVKLMQAANVNFAVLGNAERCNGETARRMGDEMLFQQLAGKNIETFERFGIKRGTKRVVSHCPHCVNSFRQDYPQLGADLEVVHHSEFLAELVKAGRLKASPTDAASITYHDPCYLARVQNVTAAPRELLGNIIEMPRCGRQTSCCGAGGGRMWFDDKPDKRVGQSRVAEALATKASTLAVSCPFCLTMTQDGIAARDGKMNVRDIAELLADALPGSEQSKPTDSPHGL